ncbi:MAG TPA: phosphate-starvation-inducible PsiE family protein [Solirubrobacterales bacterium]|jgi:uncharacterized membrane protein (DUF373 family)
MGILKRFQQLVYLIVAVLLGLAAFGVIYGTTKELVEGVLDGEGAIQMGLRLLDRVLLLLIVAELLHTLSIVLYEGEISAEPFLLVGLIAVVRRVVVVTAHIEQAPGPPPNGLLLELGVLAGLALAFGAAIYLLRRGTAREP